jgi:Flp pilus assembly protein TadG
MQTRKTMESGRKGERGQALLMVTLASVAMFGALGLAVDLGWAYYVRTSAATAADSAALAAVQWANDAILSSGGTYTCGTNGIVCNTSATACPSSPGSSTSIGAGCLYAQANGFSASGNQNVTMQSNAGSTPPTATGITNVQYWVTARVSQRIPQLFSAILGKQHALVSARSTAAVVGGITGGCVYVLHPTAAGAMTVTGTATLTAPCGIWVNSNNTRALQVTGSACVNAGTSQIRVAGNYTGSNICISPSPTTGISSFPDPLASISRPSVPSTCTSTNLTISSSVRTLNPGTYCGGITISSSIVTFNPGTYILVGGGLVASSSTSSLTGANVMFYNTACGAGYSNTVCPTGSGSYSGVYRPFNISGGLTATLSAPTSGTYNNILFMQDRTVPIQTLVETLSGGTMGNFTGAFYVPRSPLSYAGGTVTASPSMALVSYTLNITGNAYVMNGLNGPGGGGTGQRLALVE